jgi:acetyl esterase/lipase
MPPHFSPLILRGFPCRVIHHQALTYSSPAAHNPLLADLFLPDPQDAPGPLPIVLWLHSGGWIAGDRHRSPNLSRFFAERGFAMASIDYRLSRQAIFPAALHDVIAAIQWLRDISPAYNLDPQKIALWGASAGGHLAALAALSAPQTNIKAVVAAYPPTDFLQMPRSPKNYESRFLGAPVETVPQLVQQANPAAYAHPGATPFLLLHGLADTEVPSGQSEILYDALRAHDNDVTLSLVEGLGHSFLEHSDFDPAPPLRHLLRIAKPGQPEQRFEAPPLSFGAIETFFRRHL